MIKIIFNPMIFIIQMTLYKSSKHIVSFLVFVMIAFASCIDPDDLLDKEDTGNLTLEDIYGNIIFADEVLNDLYREAALTLKARVLVYAASPLFNDPQNPDDSPFRGAYNPDKWIWAAQAAYDVINLHAYSLHPDISTLFHTRFNNAIWLVPTLHRDENNQRYIEYSFRDNPRAFEERWRLMPFHDNQLLLNPNLVQNPGW